MWAWEESGRVYACALFLHPRCTPTPPPVRFLYQGYLGLLPIPPDMPFTTTHQRPRPPLPRAIVGFAFGQGPPRTSTRRRRTSSRTQPTPGGTNRGLAWSVAALLRKYRALGLPRPALCLQQEIADALGTDVVDPATDHVIPSQPADGTYVDTVAVAQHAVARLGPASRVLVVAHPDHAPRCLLTLRQLGATPMRTRYLQPLGGGIPWTRFGCDRRGYWRRSTQRWTRSRRRFLAHERDGR